MIEACLLDMATDLMRGCASWELLIISVRVKNCMFTLVGTSYYFLPREFCFVLAFDTTFVGKAPSPLQKNLRSENAEAAPEAAWTQCT
jgi:hypothetical protein